MSEFDSSLSVRDGGYCDTRWCTDAGNEDVREIIIGGDTPAFLCDNCIRGWNKAMHASPLFIAKIKIDARIEWMEAACDAPVENYNRVSQLDNYIRACVDRGLLYKAITQAFVAWMDKGKIPEECERHYLES